MLNFELNPSFNPKWVDCSNAVNHNRVQVLCYSKLSLLSLSVVRIEPEDNVASKFINQTPISIMLCVLPNLSG